MSELKLCDWRTGDTRCTEYRDRITELEDNAVIADANIQAMAERNTELEGFIDAYCGQPDQTIVFDQFKSIQDKNTKLEAKLVLHGHCPKCDGVYSRRADVGCLGCGYLEGGDR